MYDIGESCQRIGIDHKRTQKKLQLLFTWAYGAASMLLDAAKTIVALVKLEMVTRFHEMLNVRSVDFHLPIFMICAASGAGGKK